MSGHPLPSPRLGGKRAARPGGGAGSSRARSSTYARARPPRGRRL